LSPDLPLEMQSPPGNRSNAEGITSKRRDHRDHPIPRDKPARDCSIGFVTAGCAHEFHQAPGCPPFSHYCELKISRSWKHSSGRSGRDLSRSPGKRARENQSLLARCNFCWVSARTNREFAPEPISAQWKQYLAETI